MNQESIPLYIRFGKIPENKISKVHRSDAVIREEGGLSVWRACRANGRYYPLLPEDANENGIADYFHYLLYSDEPVYLVTGTELCIEGADREPLLMDDVVVIKDITNFYGRGKIIKKDAIQIVEDAIMKYIKDQDKNEVDEATWKRNQDVKDALYKVIEIIKEDKDGECK